MPKDPMVIVGAGHCGGRAAMELRDAGWNGPIHLIGEEAAAPYERPPLSKGLLTGECSATQCNFLPNSEIERLGIHRHESRATELDLESRNVLLASGHRVTYGALLIATGGRVRRLCVPGANSPQVLTLRRLGDAHRLASRLTPGRRLAIVGGGFIGLEVAASAIKMGCVVTVIETASRLMGRAVPESIARSAQALHEARGVSVRLGIGVERIDEARTGTRVVLSDASHVEADTVLVGIGIESDMTLAHDAGLEVGRGIVVNAELETSRTGVFAAGDVAEFPSVISGAPTRQETWHNAQTQARTAALNMLGRHVGHASHPWFWSDQYDHQVQVAGEPAFAVSSVIRDVGEGCHLIFYFDAGERLVGVCGWGPTSRMAKEFKLARMLVERGLVVSRESMRDPAIKLKALFQSTQNSSSEAEPAVTSPWRSVYRPTWSNGDSRVNNWIEVCALESIDDEDVTRFDHDGRTFAIYRLGEQAYATDGLCTHEQVHLCDGLVMNAVIECPRHNGRFDIRTGRALGAPVCKNLVTYPVAVEGGMVRICVRVDADSSAGRP